ncbi:MAG: four helix bundle protein [Acidobacteria bacterium]|nr:four helix bundle protein [Acidobacteriota bacterium]
MAKGKERRFCDGPPPTGAQQSRFIATQCIALNEARESRFWLRVIAATHPSTAPQVAPHYEEVSELIAMLTASIKTAKSNPHRGG